MRDAWDIVVANMRPEVRSHYRSEPRFEKDQDFLPLQAADIFAWYAREAAESKGVGHGLDLPSVKGSDHLWMEIYIDQDWMVDRFARLFKPVLPPGTQILDRKTGRPADALLGQFVHWRKGEEG